MSTVEDRIATLRDAWPDWDDKDQVTPHYPEPCRIDNYAKIDLMRLCEYMETNFQVIGAPAVTEAPLDGQIYGRKNAAWDPLSGGGGGSTPGGSSGQLQWNNNAVMDGMSGTSWDPVDRSLTLTGATVTASHPVLDLSQTWNNSGTTFTGLRLNVTSTASAAGSLFSDFQVGGSSQIQFGINHSTFANGPFLSFCNGQPTINSPSIGQMGASAGLVLTGNPGAGLMMLVNNFGGPVQIVIPGQGSFGWTAGGLSYDTQYDTALWRDGTAGIIAQRNGTSAQSLRVYNTFTDASNYERGVFDWRMTPNVLTIGTQAAGTGTLRNMVFIAGTKAGAPTTADIPAGTWALIRDTSGSTTKIYYNNAGTLQSVALA